MPVRSGHRVGAYRLDGLLSRGGMGEIWLATRIGAETWEKQVALKLILPTMADQERFARMLLEEAKIAGQLDHPNIVPVFDFGREGELLFFAQEYVRGADLHRLLMAARFPLPLALYVTGEMLEGLGYAHERRGPDGRPLGIVHRDIKPQNVLVSTEGNVKIADFGIAKATAETPGSSTDLKGTAGYIAPEILLGRPPTAQADLFAVGLVLWEILVGKKLFEGDTEAQRLQRTMECVVPPLAEAGVAAPAAVEGFLRQLLARRPEDRFPSASAALDALLALPTAREARAVDLKRFVAPLMPAETFRPARGTPAQAATPTHTLAGEVTHHQRPGGLDPARTSTRVRRRRWWVACAMVPLAAASVYVAVTLDPRTWRAKPEPPSSATASVQPTDERRHPTVLADAGLAAPAPTTITVRIDVDPPDAALLVDGRLQPGRAPYVLAQVAPDRPLRLRLERQGFEPWQREVLPAEIPPTIRLEKQRGSAKRPRPRRDGRKQGPWVDLGGRSPDEVPVEK